MNIFFIVIIAFAMLSSFFRNNDIFSPVKWYFLSLVTYFNDVFVKEVSIEVSVMFFCFIIVGIVFSRLEKKNTLKNTRLNQRKELKNQNSIFLFFILLSFIPISVQFYFFSLYGGLYNYVSGIATRVLDWQGFGYLTALLSIYSIINTILLIIIFKFKIKKIWLRVFVIHFIILVLMGALSGSRSAMLFGFVHLIVFYNYFRNRVTLKAALPFALILIIGASFLAIVRNEFRVSDNEVAFLKDKLEISEASLGDSYGIFSFQKVIEKPFDDYQYGLTYLTTITNFIPRLLWPEKPSSAGVIITKFIDGKYYSGTSHYTPGLICEGIINFGYYFGPVFAIILLIFLGTKIIKFYNTKLFDITSNTYHTYQNTIIYPYILLINTKIMGGILVGEFTAVFFDFLKTYIILFFIVLLMKVLGLKFNNILR